MHRILFDALKRAHGLSQHVIVVSADVRGFSVFSKENDSVDVATYISKIYLSLIRTFRTVSPDVFFKTTGDGLMLVIPFAEENLKSLFTTTVRQCLAIHKEFGSILDGIPVIDFETPQSIGIGIARGSACALLSKLNDEELILDYSGHKLNLAARLQDLARPSGVILGGKNDMLLLPATLKKRFHPEEVYVRSVAETTPMTVHALQCVEISPRNQCPLGGTEELIEKSWTRSQLADLSNYVFDLKTKVIDIRSLEVRFRWRNKKDKRLDMSSWRTLELEEDYDVVQLRGVQHVKVKFPAILTAPRWVDVVKLGPRTVVRLEISYTAFG